MSSAEDRIRARWQYCCVILFENGWKIDDLVTICEALKHIRFSAWLSSTTDPECVELAIYRNLETVETIGYKRSKSFRIIANQLCKANIQRAIMFVKDEFHHGDKQEVIQYYKSLGGF